MLNSFARATNKQLFHQKPERDSLSTSFPEQEEDEIDVEDFEPLIVIDDPVQQKFVGPLVVFSIFTVIACCSAATYIVRTARDSRITLNALSIRR